MKEQYPLISVIVPAYKVENDIRRCVESIQCQTYYNLEIILVDDGSPDRCGAIFEQMKLMDERIVVIHKENGGLSDARNAALDVMKGTYVTFVDGDDFVHKDYILHLYKVMCKYRVAIAVCDEQRFVMEKGGPVFTDLPVQTYRECKFSAEDGMIEFLYQRKFDTSAWGKLYLASLFSDIRYPKGKQFEDLATTYRLFLKVSHIAFFNEKLYMYQIRMTSQMRTGFNIGKTDGIAIAESVREDLGKRGRRLYKACNCRCLSMYFHVLLDIPKDEYKELQTDIWKRIKKNRARVLLDMEARHKTKMAVLLSYGGIGCCRYIFKRINGK